MVQLDAVDNSVRSRARELPPFLKLALARAAKCLNGDFELKECSRYEHALYLAYCAEAISICIVPKLESLFPIATSDKPLQALDADNVLSAEEMVTGLNRYSESTPEFPDHLEDIFSRSLSACSEKTAKLLADLSEKDRWAGNIPDKLARSLLAEAMFDAMAKALTWFREIYTKCSVSEAREAFNGLKKPISLERLAVLADVMADCIP